MTLCTLDSCFVVEMSIFNTIALLICKLCIFIITKVRTGHALV